MGNSNVQQATSDLFACNAIVKFQTELIATSRNLRTLCPVTCNMKAYVDIILIVKLVNQSTTWSMVQTGKNEWMLLVERDVGWFPADPITLFAHRHLSLGRFSVLHTPSAHHGWKQLPPQFHTERRSEYTEHNIGIQNTEHNIGKQNAT